MRTETINGMVWVVDGSNRASVLRWGSEDAAKASLGTLSDCSGCSDCSRCSGCSGCSDMAPQKIDMKIPVIEDIHAKLFDAVSQPNALDMREWHTCDTTHCRAGWS